MYDCFGSMIFTYQTTFCDNSIAHTLESLKLFKKNILNRITLSLHWSHLVKAIGTITMNSSTIIVTEFAGSKIFLRNRLSDNFHSCAYFQD